MKLEKAVSSPKNSIGEAWLPRGWLRSRVPGARARWERRAWAAAGLLGSSLPCSAHRLPLPFPAHETYCRVLILV